MAPRGLSAGMALAEGSGVMRHSDTRLSRSLPFLFDACLDTGFDACLVAGFVATLVACATGQPPAGAHANEPIVHGVLDHGHPAVVAIEAPGWLCTGTLVAP